MDRHGLDRTLYRPTLVEPIVSPKNLHSPLSENLVSSLLQRERPILAPLAECRRPLDVAFEEDFPAKIEPIGDSLDALAPHGFPMRHPAVSQLREVPLKFCFGQRLFEQTIVAPMQRNRVIPDFRRGIDSAMEMFEPFAAKKLELKGLTHWSTMLSGYVDESSVSTH
jgi:hypothetical protein